MNPDGDWLLLNAMAAFARIAGCFMLLPGFSSARVPQTIRVIFTLALTVSVMGFLPGLTGTRIQNSSFIYFEVLFWETTAGAIIGLGTRYYLLAISFFASAASSVVGFNSLVNPSSIENEVESPMASLISYASLICLFSLDFHHRIVISLVNSYAVFPHGSPISFALIARNLISMLDEMFSLVIRLGFPFIAYSIVSNIFVALLNRLTPALQLYFVLSPLILVGGLIIAYFVFPSVLSFVSVGLTIAELYK